MELPLSDIRVIDAATFVAAPFCGTLLGEFGAEVIKIEQPRVGDPLRRFGTEAECGDTYAWLSESRNKRSVSLDLRTSKGAEIFGELAAKADVILENFRPGTMKKWGLGYDTLSKINPQIIMLHISAYGQTGPKSGLPGFARVAHAFGGLAYLAGESGRVPVVPGSASLADYMSGLFGAFGVLTALRHAEKTGEGQEIDLALYESIFRVMDEMAPAYAANGLVRERMGPDTVNAVPHSHYLTSDGEWIALACTNDRMWQRLAILIMQDTDQPLERFAGIAERISSRDELNKIVQRWVATHNLVDVLEKCSVADVPCSKLLSIKEIFEDVHYAARGNLLKILSERAGELVVPAPVPIMSKTQPQFKFAGEALGASNDYVFRELLGYSDARIRKLAADGII
jgi:crotonobetainyl-CoA:carnitine CoA-transferase CaiB-like acyl-CoA transferase